MFFYFLGDSSSEYTTFKKATSRHALYPLVYALNEPPPIMTYFRSLLQKKWTFIIDMTPSQKYDIVAYNFDIVELSNNIHEILYT